MEQLSQPCTHLKTITIAFSSLILLFFFSGCSKPTEACFSFSPATIVLNQPVTFDASCSKNAAYFKWNFGDNSPDTTITSVTTTHLFSSSGQYTVTLTANRKDGSSFGKDKFTTTQVVTVP